MGEKLLQRYAWVEEQGVFGQFVDSEPTTAHAQTKRQFLDRTEHYQQTWHRLQQCGIEQSDQQPLPTGHLQTTNPQEAKLSTR